MYLIRIEAAGQVQYIGVDRGARRTPEECRPFDDAETAARFADAYRAKTAEARSGALRAPAKIRAAMERLGAITFTVTQL